MISCVKNDAATLSVQGLIVIFFMQDLSKLRSYIAHYCKEIFFEFFLNLGKI